MNTENINTAGGLLRQGRLRQRLSIGECSKRTHIAARFIEALEEERWADLPSESHRLGFLKLYSRFLGAPVDDIVKLYLEKGLPPPGTSSSSPQNQDHQPKRENQSFGSGSRWSPNSIPQIIGIGILLLLLSWVVYHAVIPHLFEQNPMPWAHRRISHQARLVVQQSIITNHKISIKAQADSWMRVTSHHELLFEGILPAGGSKIWSQEGPFQLKIGNVHAVTLFWNDQPVDIISGARGTVNEIRIPQQ